MDLHKFRDLVSKLSPETQAQIHRSTGLVLDCLAMDQARLHSTLARVAGNILSGRSSFFGSNLEPDESIVQAEARLAVRLARAILAEIEKTDVNPRKP